MPQRSWAIGLALVVLAIPVSSAVETATHPSPTPVPGLEYVQDFFPGVSYDAAVPTPESLLGYPVGRRAASPEEIASCLRAWDEASSRTKLVEYAKSHEGRSLFYMVVTSPANLARLDEVRDGMERLADPRELSAAEADRLLGSLPAVGWLAYSIHGNETSGSDSALALIYHLAAAQSEEVTRLLDEVVVLIDPMMNPDGRARFVKSAAEHRGTAPNLDDQSLLHSGYWPWGRMNHYLFDLNRDWTLGVNPETRGRIRAAGSWHPLLLVDAHEMGPQDTYLFSPQRDPRNPRLPERRGHWNSVFARDQAAVFDRNLWPYYTGEWNEGWYPGYSDAWAAFRGAVGILYEQASVNEDGIRRADGGVLSYRQSVHHQLVSSLANLETLQANGRELLREFLEERRRAVASSGPFADQTFAILPTGNTSRLRGFLDLMELQRFEVYVTDKEIVVPSAEDQLGRSSQRPTLPAGTILIPNRQPEAHLLATMLEFDHPMPPEYFEREREEILRHGRSTIYDVTAWNITMLHGLKALTLSSGLPDGAKRFGVENLPQPNLMQDNASIIAWVIDGADDDSVVAAARLMERGVEVRVAEKAFKLSTQEFSRGSVVVTRRDNRRFGDDLPEVMARTVEELQLEAHGITSGLGEGALPDLGGGFFKRLEPPRIALLARGGISPYDFGSLWHTLDQRFAIRHSHLDEDSFALDEDGLAFSDLRRYNVVVLPDRWFGKLSENAKSSIRSWVRAGGTLVAIGTSAGEMAEEEAELSKVRELPDVLDNLDEYELAVLREWMVRQTDFPESDHLWGHVASTEATFPWQDLEERPAQEELERRDQWQQLFMPRGAILTGRADTEHWLTFGSDDWLPILVGNYPILMAGRGVEAPVRFGYPTPAAESSGGERVGWAALPEGQELRLRMSGLLWPEAAERLAHSAYVTRESVGSGQIILFAAPPTFRATTMATARLLTNALIYGPGFGAQHLIRP